MFYEKENRPEHSSHLKERGFFTEDNGTPIFNSNGLWGGQASAAATF